MKFRNLLFLLLAFSFFACEEVPPVVTGSMGGPGGPDPATELKDQKRQVLIEEFTGVHCVQCPAGSAHIETLLNAHGEQLVAVSIHAGDFAVPHPNSQYDFNIPAGNDILAFLGEPLGYPSSVVDRTMFDGEGVIQLLGTSKWAGYIEQEKEILPKVKIGIDTEFDPATRELKIGLLLLVEETITEESRLSIMFTESNIIDPQTVPNVGVVDDYVHNHALRGMATNPLGDIISEDLTAGSLIEKNYTFTVPTDWAEENCRVIAFVHLGGDSKEVLQAAEAEMVK